MPKRKITLDEAYAVFEAHGLQVEVKGIQQQNVESLSAFLEDAVVEQPVAEELSGKTVKITLYAAHSLACGGEAITDKKGNTQVINNGIETYGPGIVTVPAKLASHLLHQDMLARRGDDRMLETRQRNYVVVRKMTATGAIVNTAAYMGNGPFDMSSTLADLGKLNTHFIG